MKADEILAAIKKHYGDSAIVVPEVGDSTGAYTKRHIDALALGCWPSRGLFVHVIEIKVSKSDFRSEMKSPEKADAIARYCDCMFLAAPKGLVEPAELPDGWGLLEVSSKGVRVCKVAQKIDSDALDRKFVMAICRAVVNRCSEEVEIEKRIAAATDTMSKTYNTIINDLNRSMQENRDELLTLRRMNGGRNAMKIALMYDALENIQSDWRGTQHLVEFIERLLSDVKVLQTSIEETLPVIPK